MRAILVPLLLSLFVATAGASQKWAVLAGHWQRGTGCSSSAVVCPGDIDGDGRGDLLIGAPNGDMACVSLSGEDAKAILYSPALGQALAILTNDIPSDGFGRSVGAAGDIDGDSVPDLLVGAPGTRVGGVYGCGAVYLYSGRTRSLLYRVLGTSLDGSTGEGLGSSVDGGPDLDGDGVPDFASGSGAAFDTTATRRGLVRVFSGANGAELYRAWGRVVDDEFGSEVRFMADIDGDSVADLIVGAPGCGSVYLLSGRDGSELKRMTTPSGCITGYGTSLTAIPDLDSDGKADLAIGAPFATGPQSGLVYVQSSTTDSLLLIISPLPMLSAFGQAMATGDYDGDGKPDLAVGAPQAPDQAIQNPHAGRADVYSQAGISEDLRLTGWKPYQLLGSSLATVADVNGDGRQDLAVGSPGWSMENGYQIGGVVIYAFTEVHPASVRFNGGNPGFRLDSGGEFQEVLIEPAQGSFDLTEVDPSSIAMRLAGDPVRETREVAVDSALMDRDGDGVGDWSVSFERAAIRSFWDFTTGSSFSDSVTVDGTLTDGSRFQATAAVVIKLASAVPSVSIVPNPLTAGGNLTFLTSRPGRVSIRVFDVQGHLLRTPLEMPSIAAGYHDVRINRVEGGRRLSSGVYLIRVETVDGVSERKVVLVN